MEFGKMAMMTLYARQQKRHRCVEQTLDSEGEGEVGNDFLFFEFIKVRFMAQDVIYPGEGSVST